MESRRDSKKLDAAGLDEALESAADREELLLQALRIAGVGGWELDIATGTLNWSEETYRIFGVSPETFKPTPDHFYELVHPDDRAAVLARQDTSTDSATLFVAEYRIVTPGGETRYVKSRAEVVARGKQKTNRFLGVVQDVTERRLFEQALDQQQAISQRLQSDLIHISRVSAMDAMASALAHELNQPLTAIANYATGLRKLAAPEADADSPSAMAVQAIHDNSRRAGEIIRRLRAMTTREEIRKAPVELAGCIMEAVDLALMGSNVPATMALDEDLYVDADRIQIQQVVINLVRNAIEAMEGRPDQALTVAAAVEGDIVATYVRDTGAGIAEEILPTIFDSFVSTKPRGMGIGLAISRTIIEAHGGRLTVRSTPGHGSEFCFTLPRAAAPDQA